MSQAAVAAPWRQRGAILLVSCYEQGRPPLAAALPAAVLRQAGFQPTLVDLSVEPLEDARLSRTLLVGISAPMHTALRIGLQVAERVRRLSPGCTIVFFGHYALLNRDRLERAGDHCLGGELEEDLLALVETLERGEPPTIPGTPTLRRLQRPPVWRGSLPTLDAYARLEHRGRRALAGAVESTRGCKHLCRHCPIPPVYQGRFFAAPVDVVLEDVARLVAAGAEHVTFADPDFLNGPGHARRVARALHAAHPELTFDFTAKVSHLIEQAELLAELGRLGCLFVVSAVESLSEEVLQVLAKGHDRVDIDRALEVARAARIALRPSLLPFTPWSTLEDYQELLAWVEREGLIDHVDPVQYSVRLLLPPGSLLLERDDLRRHLRGAGPDGIGHRWEHPDPRMDLLQRRVAATLEEHQDEDPWLTFQRVLALARAAHDPETAPRPIEARPSAADRPRPPRLTESWFC